MPLNEQKIIRIIFNECESIEERYDGYRDDLVILIADIITDERQHRVQGTNIQQKINDKCNAAGDYLARKRGQAQITEGGV